MFANALAYAALYAYVNMVRADHVSDSVVASPHVLVYTKTAGYRHDSIPTAIEVLGENAEKYGLTFTFTEDEGIFVDEALSQFDGVLFVHTTEEVLADYGKEAFRKWLNSGGVFGGVHAASGCMYNDGWYKDTVGALFDWHPEFQNATFLRLDTQHPSTKDVPDKWRFGEEVYFFGADPRSVGATVVMTVEEGSFDNPMGPKPEQGTPHPIAWYNENARPGDKLEPGCNKKGRMFYTALGHANETWHDDTFLNHLLSGYTWALDGATTRAYGNGLVGNTNTSSKPVYPPPPPPVDNSTANASSDSTEGNLAGTNNNNSGSTARFGLSAALVAVATAAGALFAL